MTAEQFRELYHGTNPDLSSGLMAGAWRCWTALLGMNLASGGGRSPAGAPGGRGPHRPPGPPSSVAGVVCPGQGACGTPSVFSPAPGNPSTPPPAPPLSH